MNNLKHITGKLELIKKLENETLNEQCKRLVEEKYGKHDLDKANYFGYIDVFMDGFYDSHIIVDNNIYKVLKTDSEYKTAEKFNIIDNLDGTYDFDVLYDGSYDFEDAIEEALKCKSYKSEFKPKATVASLHIEPEDIVIIEYDNSKLKQKELADLCSLVNDSMDNMVIALPLPCRAITKTKTQLSYIADKLKEIAEEM